MYAVGTLGFVTVKYLNVEYIFVPARNVNLEDLGVFTSLIFYQNFVHYFSQKLTIFDLKYQINHSQKDHKNSQNLIF